MVEVKIKFIQETRIFKKESEFILIIMPTIQVEKPGWKTSSHFKPKNQDQVEKIAKTQWVYIDSIRLLSNFAVKIVAIIVDYTCKLGPRNRL